MYIGVYIIFGVIVAGGLYVAYNLVLEYRIVMEMYAARKRAWIITCSNNAEIAGQISLGEVCVKLSSFVQAIDRGEAYNFALSNFLERNRFCTEQGCISLLGDIMNYASRYLAIFLLLLILVLYALTKLVGALNQRNQQLQYAEGFIGPPPTAMLVQHAIKND